ncbi:hypothetical protein QE382_001808 [Sphingobacterium zeae]|uniref:Uncharacterized protein n=1 Tax=Sphingobacterium zeae TaxID=1776859 RepID=A0ABU0U4D6_9SPHI|nr:hypothetical protein [Sphingobacterium zeae]
MNTALLLLQNRASFFLCAFGQKMGFVSLKSKRYFYGLDGSSLNRAKRNDEYGEAKNYFG